MSAGEPSATTTAAPSMFSAPLAETDPQLAEALRLELGRQRDDIELIASENYVSRAVLEAQGSVLTNKYAEGYPGTVSYTHLRAHETRHDIVCRLLLEKKKKQKTK